MIILLPISLLFVVVLIQQIAKASAARSKAQQRARELGARPGWTHRGR